MPSATRRTLLGTSSQFSAVWKAPPILAWWTNVAPSAFGRLVIFTVLNSPPASKWKCLPAGSPSQDILVTKSGLALGTPPAFTAVLSSWPPNWALKRDGKLTYPAPTNCCGFSMPNPQAKLGLGCQD